VTVGETTFARRIRAAPAPVLILFAASRCNASRALAPILARLADQHLDKMLVLRVDVDRSPLLAEQHGILATPTVLILQDGEEWTRITGFAPERLLRVLFEQVLAGEIIPGRIWSPIEQVFEDAVIIPLLEDLGWRYKRQVACPSPAGARVARGRVDILVYADGTSGPITLFENKRLLLSTAALHQAVAQARRYAAAFGLQSFVIAAPAGLWIYRLEDGRAELAQAFSSLDVATRPEVVEQALRWL
jgi:thiol-disulfide isomerase/thioredoxin